MGRGGRFSSSKIYGLESKCDTWEVEGMEEMGGYAKQNGSEVTKQFPSSDGFSIVNLFDSGMQLYVKWGSQRPKLIQN